MPPAPGASVRTRIMIISDTHCAPLVSDGKRVPIPPFAAPLPAADLLIHCGDLTMDGDMEEYIQTLDMLKSIDAPVKFVIAGNHDLSLDRDFVLKHREQDGLTLDQAEAKVRAAHDLWTHPDERARMEGITFLHEGVHQIRLANGALIKVYASPYTPEFWDWGFPYERDEDRFNEPAVSLSDAKNIADHPVPTFTAAEAPLDIMITHGPAYGHLDKTQDGILAGCPHLLRAVMRARPTLHVFGHIHEGYGAHDISWSSNTDEIAKASTTIAGWRGGAWRAGIAQTSKLSADLTKREDSNCNHVDLTGASAPKRGESTLMVNAAIMNVRYRPVNAPWIVDVDLPKAS